MFRHQTPLHHCPFDMGSIFFLHLNMDFSKEMCVFTDGSALCNKKDAPAGWAMYIPVKKVLISKGMFGTNNQAELEAIRFALWFLKENINDYTSYIHDNHIFLLSDSEYSINAITGKNKVKANENKIKACRIMIKELKQMGYTIRFEHVMAHTGGTDFVSFNNNIVDMAARKKATEMKQSEPEK